MAWLRRPGIPSPPEPETREVERPAAVVRAAPGLASLFQGLTRDSSHSVLDLGEGSSGNLRFYGRFARRVRFADLIGSGAPEGSWIQAMRSIPKDPRHPYDVVVAWNLLDRMEREQRPMVVERLVELTAPGSRLYVLTDLSGERFVRPLRFALLDNERVAHESVGPLQAACPTILPAELERLLEPFRVEHSFVLRIGMREYVAVRP